MTVNHEDICSNQISGAKFVALPIAILAAGLISGCAIGRASYNPCEFTGFTVGKSIVHISCAQSRKITIPIKEPVEEKLVAFDPYRPVNCKRYNYYHECIDALEEPRKVVMERGEAYIEFSGGPPTGGFWSGVFDVLTWAGTALAARFGLGF